MSAKRMAELVDALVSNTCGKPCRFDSAPGIKTASFKRFFLLYKIYFIGGISKKKLC
jgi:hypothetical protein